VSDSSPTVPVPPPTAARIISTSLLLHLYRGGWRGLVKTRVKVRRSVNTEPTARRYVRGGCWQLVESTAHSMLVGRTDGRAWTIISSPDQTLWHCVHSARLFDKLFSQECSRITRSQAGGAVRVEDRALPPACPHVPRDVVHNHDPPLEVVRPPRPNTCAIFPGGEWPTWVTKSQNIKSTGLAQKSQVYPVVWLKIPMRALELTQILGQPCGSQVQAGGYRRKAHRVRSRSRRR
jgi:hypothetical protein